MQSKTETVQIKVDPADINDPKAIQRILRSKAKRNYKSGLYWQILKKSIDARKSKVQFVLNVELATKQDYLQDPSAAYAFSYNKASKNKDVLIIGAGPAGYFAALECLEQGLKPIVIDRGKDVQARRRDLRAIQQFNTVNPDSNYCFGEGGAGTYSDGKLYTRSKKRGKILKTLKLLVDHGANSEILIDAHPHIGSNKLPKIISEIRKTIESHGGEVLFDHKVTDFKFEDGQCKSVVVNNDKEMHADAYILATGHSARDIYELLHKHRIYIEAKPFALGIRIEHPQALIDEIQYNQFPRHENLPAASYKLVTQVDGAGVFSFCMCPGGLIVPAATAPGEIVVNGMSLSKRDSPFANSGIVTAISNEVLIAKGYSGVFANMNFQKEVEQSLFKYGNGGMQAPAQNMIDFVNGKDMLDLNETSYIPGIYKAPLHELLPDFVYNKLKDGLLAFALKMKGYFTDEANVVATESRTSAPVRIPRHNESLSHIQIDNLYPCGEGAGYAGGILSAAMDGQRVVKAIAGAI